jgi:predicted alpha-1,2-mannosidase
MSGSCTQDYGSMSVMPFTTSIPDTVSIAPTDILDHHSEISEPSYYSIDLPGSGIKAELTGSVRSCIMRFTFSGSGEACIYIRINSDEKQGSLINDNDLITAKNPVHRIYQGWGRPAGFSGWFVLQFNKPYRVVKTLKNNQEYIISFGAEKKVEAYIGTSFTGAKAALENLNAEIPHRNFEILRKESENVWNSILGKIKVKGGSDEDMTKFYTALYHCYQLPRIVSDRDGSYPGFADDTLIRKTDGFDYYDDFSMWDTYRALHPLMTILEPERTLDMVKSLILKAEQGGWIPIFPAWNSYTAAMIGDHVSTTIADAYLKGINNFDTAKAFFYMKKNAFEIPDRREYVDGKGRRALESYMKYGFIPLEDSVWDAFHKREQVSRTLEYALDDYALSRYAASIGRHSDSEELKERSLNYANVFDTSTGFVRGRYSDGRWIEPFDPYSKASYICEGTPFHYTWYVPHDVPGLIDLMGGRKRFLERLSKFFDEGDYWHGNETDQQAPFLFAMAGEPSRTQLITRRINDEEYGTGPGGLSGNEDAGQMSAWLVFSMIGFYPVCPGSGEYILTMPAFPEISISTVNGKGFNIISPGMTRECNHIISARKNGKRFRNISILHTEIVRGGELRFRTGP